MIKITRFPEQPINVLEQFILGGTASPSYAGRNLTLIVDNQFQAAGPKVGPDGSWSVAFLFQQAGNRRLRVRIDNESAEVVIRVVAVARLRFTEVPQAGVTGRTVTFKGEADRYANGTGLLLRADGRFELARPQVQGGKWEASMVFGQAGRRSIEILGTGQDKAQVAINITEAPPTPPRLRFTTIPARIQTGQTVVFGGEADGYQDGYQLLLRADPAIELGKPSVLAGKWQAPAAFNQAGNRTIEIIGSEQDKAQIQVTVVAAPSSTRPPRVSFTNVPAQIRTGEVVTLSGEAVNYRDNDQLVLRVDGKIELARPRVQGSRWEAKTVFNQAGKRLLEIMGSEQDKAQREITVLPSTTGAQILSRSTWTNEPTPSDLANLQPLRITLHHTFISPTPSVNASQAGDVERLRLIWRSHVQGNGWSDIGYHYIIMPSGRIFEARSERKRGAHDVINDGLGIAFDGLYSNATISPQQFASAVALCTILCKRYNINDPVTPVPTPTSDFGTRNIPRICGHRDRVQTECPGSEGGTTIRLAEIRRAVKALL